MSEMSNIGGEQPTYRANIPPGIKGNVPAPTQAPTEQAVHDPKQTNLNDNPAFMGGKSQVKPAKVEKFERKPFVDPAKVASDVNLYAENHEMLATFKGGLYNEAVQNGMSKEQAVKFAEHAAAAFLQLPQ